MPLTLNPQILNFLIYCKYCSNRCYFYSIYVFLNVSMSWMVTTFILMHKISFAYEPFLLMINCFSLGKVLERYQIHNDEENAAPKSVGGTGKVSQTFWPYTIFFILLFHLFIFLIDRNGSPCLYSKPSPSLSIETLGSKTARRL